MTSRNLTLAAVVIVAAIFWTVAASLAFAERL